MYQLLFMCCCSDMFQVVSCIHLSSKMPPMANKNLDKCVLLLRQMMDRDSGKSNICRHQEAKYYFYVLLLLTLVVRGYNGHSLISVFFFFDFFFSTCISFSVSSHQFLLSIALIIHSSPTHSRSLFTQSSHHDLGLLCLLSSTILWTFASFPSGSPPILPT